MRSSPSCKRELPSWWNVGAAGRPQQVIPPLHRGDRHAVKQMAVGSQREPRIPVPRSRGDVLRVLPRGPSLRVAYERAGWPGVQLRLLRENPKTDEFLRVQEALRESVMFHAWGWVLDECEHPL